MTSRVDTRVCEFCGRKSRRECGLLKHVDICGLPDPRRIAHRVYDHPNGTLESNNPMHQGQMAQARAALSAMSRCGAHARTSGAPCKNVACKGSNRCRMHGGRSSGAPKKHGNYSQERKRNEHFVRIMLSVIAATEEKCD